MKQQAYHRWAVWKTKSAHGQADREREDTVGAKKRCLSDAKTLEVGWIDNADSKGV
ncbi:MAG: hypothetical protein LOD88_01930 [Novibacillus thermophilus]